MTLSEFLSTLNRSMPDCPPIRDAEVVFEHHPEEGVYAILSVEGIDVRRDDDDKYRVVLW